MKILMLSEDFLPNVGGITSHIVYLSKALVERGHKVVVLKPSQKESKRFVHEYGFEVIHLKKRYPYLLNKLCIRKFIKELFEKEKFDLLHWHQLVGYETKFLGKIPKVFTNHTSMYLEEYEKARGRMRLRVMLSHVDAIISPSLELQSKSEIISPPLGNYYIPNGIDESRFKPAIKGEEPGFKFLAERKLNGESIILCPRRLETKCGVKYFVESVPKVLARIPGCYFVVAGRGGFFDEEERLKDYLKGKNVLDRVKFLGDVENDDMPFLYNLSDIVAFPSLMEATSISCLEAMSSGKAIVSTDVGGLPELIDNGVDGLLIKPRDPSAMAEKIILLVKDKKLRNRLGRSARKKVEKSFSWTRIAGRTDEVYKKVLKSYS